MSLPNKPHAYPGYLYQSRANSRGPSGNDVEYFSKCISPASFDAPEVWAGSTWIEHAPFAFWLVNQHRPQVIVELGTYLGYSYLCFCEQVKKSGLTTRCFAVDTWRGDVHNGFYGEEVFTNLARFHDPRYASFSSLVRLTFDEAVKQFANGSIDLLHLDGRHFYEDVRHDFETWRPKLSTRAIVLFHDTQVREHGFGVFQFWQEISSALPHFEFTHNYGLGVLAVGPEAASLPLFAAATDVAASQAIRNAYARLGAVISRSRQLVRQRAEVERLKGELAAARNVPA